MIIQKNISLKNFTTIHIGGSSKNIYFPESKEDILNLKKILLLPKTLMVANAAGHEQAMAEYVIGTVLALSLDLISTHNNFKSGSWEKTGTLSDPKSMHNEVSKKTLGILGYGQIGVEVSKRAQSLGMQTYGIKR